MPTFFLSHTLLYLTFNALLIVFHAIVHLHVSSSSQSRHLFSIILALSLLHSGLSSVQVQEEMREAVNNLVKHFHKAEQEVGCV